LPELTIEPVPTTKKPMSTHAASIAGTSRAGGWPARNAPMSMIGGDATAHSVPP
jgi:hypothetical protein